MNSANYGHCFVQEDSAACATCSWARSNRSVTDCLLCTVSTVTPGELCSSELHGLFHQTQNFCVQNTGPPFVKSWHAMDTLEGRHRHYAYISTRWTTVTVLWGGELPCLHSFGRTVLALPFTNKNKLYPSNVYWTVHHCNSWRMKDQLDVTCYFISLIMCSTCFGH